MRGSAVLYKYDDHKSSYPMPRPSHYVPTIRKEIVCALYHEARLRHMPMTRLVNHLLSESLQTSSGWLIAQVKASAAPGQSTTSCNSKQ